MDKLIRNNTKILNLIPVIIADIHKQAMGNFSNNMNILISLLCETTSSINSDELQPILQSILDAQASHDYLLLADILEDNLLAFFKNLQYNLLLDDYCDIQINCYEDNCRYLNEKVLSALNTSTDNTEIELSIATNGEISGTYRTVFSPLHLCSTINPTNEARELVHSFYSSEYDTYYMFGIGMGYHIRELLALSSSIKVIVLESNIDILRCALTYNDFTQVLENNRLEIRYNKQVDKLLCGFEDSYLFIHYPSLSLLEASPIKRRLEDYFVNTSSMIEQSQSLHDNFRILTSKYPREVGELSPLFNNQTVVVVAGGPSVDEEIATLQTIRPEVTVFAVGRIASKLIKAGVHVDAIIITDPNEVTMRQLTDINGCEIPLILLSTAYYKLGDNYRGEKYIAYQEGFPKAEALAMKYGYKMYKTGGSVSTTATDIAVRLGAKKIIFVGLDLAYTNDMTHATGANEESAIQSDTAYRYVVSTKGKMIKTIKNLDIYRKWIEDRISSEPAGMFINTGSGAKIKGTLEMDLAHALKYVR